MRPSLLVIVTAALLFFSPVQQAAFSAMKGGQPMEITSSGFKAAGPIPAICTCDGQDISPSLSWKEVPAGVQSLALICDDPDAPAGTWVHWVIYNIPPRTEGLMENVKGESEFPDGMKQGRNSWSKIGYGGPCPPSGTHRYYFKLYALDAMLDLAPGATKAQVLAAMQGHVLAEAQLMGTYQRHAK